MLSVGIISIIIIFLLVMSYFDYKYLKVSNWLTGTFLIFSLTLFLFTISTLTLIHYILLILAFLLGFLLFYFELWGAADTKVYFSLLFLFFYFFEDSINLVYLFFNTLLIYSVSLLVIIFLKLSFKEKRKAFLKIDFYYKILSTVLVIFLFSHFFYWYYLFNLNEVISIFLALLLFIFFLYFFFSLFKKVYDNFLNQELWFLFSIQLFIYLLLTQSFLIFFSFLILFGIKILIQFVENSFKYLRRKDNLDFYSPFVLYLSLGFLVTLILNTFIVLFILNLFF